MRLFFRSALFTLLIAQHGVANSQNIGINTDGSAGSTLLHTKNTTAATDNILRIENTIAAQKAGINFLNSGTANSNWLFHIPVSSTDLRLQTYAGTDAVTFLNNGNVAIGTTSTSYKLEVNGGAGNGNFRFTAAAVNPILTLNGDATNGYYPSIEFNPLGNSSVGGVLQSNSTLGGISAAPRGGPFRVTGNTTNKTTIQLDLIANQTGDALQIQDYVSQYVLASFAPTSAANVRQKFFLYNTLEATPTNYERLAIYPDNTNNIFRIDAERAGTGTQRNLTLQTGAGNVGIGTTAPSSQLHVVGAQPNDSFIAKIHNTTLSGELLQGLNHLGNEVISMRADATSGFLSVNDVSGVRNSVIHSTSSYFLGNVGIGASAPSNKLTITTATALDGIIHTDGTRWMRYMSGTVGLGSYNNMVQANDNAIIFSAGALGTGAFVIAPWAAATSGLRIDNSGKVGIGISSPVEELHVVGDIRASSLAGTGTNLTQADANGTLSRSNLSGLIAPLVAMDMAHHFDPATNNPNHCGIMAGFVPSTGKVYIISTNYTTNIENMDIPSGTVGNEWNPDGGNNMIWVDFGDPNGAGTAYVQALDVAVSSFENNDQTSAMITARMSDGNLYLRSTTGATISCASLDNTASWGAWVLMADPGE